MENDKNTNNISLSNIDGTDDVSQSTNINENSHSVLTEEVDYIPKGKFFLQNVGKALLKIVLWVADLLWSVVLSLGHFFMMIGLGVYKFGKLFYKFFKMKIRQFKYNDWSGRLSFVIFGTSSFVHKQYGNGLMYLIFEIGYIVFMCLFGFNAIGMLSSLGITPSGTDPNCTDTFCDYIVGDNSVMVLVYGLLCVFSLFAFAYIWNRSIVSGYDNNRIHDYMKYKDVFSKNIEYSNKLDAQVYEAINKNIKKSEFKKSHVSEFNAYLQKFSGEGDAKFETGIAKIIFVEEINKGYEDFRNILKYDAKIAKVQNKLSKYLEKRSTDKVAIVENSHKENDEDLIFFNNETAELSKKYEDEIKVLVDKKAELLKNHTLNDKQIKNIDFKIKDKKDHYAEFLKFRESKKASLIRSRDKEELLFDGTTSSKANKYKGNIKKLNNKKTELIKMHNSYAVYESTQNEFKYGKFNVYYKTVGSYNNDLVFYKNYKKICDAYDLAKTKYAEQNKKNIEKKKEIALSEETRINEVNKKFDEMFKNKKTIEEKIKSLKVEEESKIKKAKSENKTEEAILDIKADYFKEISSLAGSLNKLPDNKAMKGMKKEEINEIKHACSRDSKALKTNYTAESYANEEACNYMLLNLDFDFKYANEMVKKLNKKDRNNGHLNENEVNKEINTLNESLNKYVSDNKTCFVGKSKTFKEQVSSLFNENFHKTILTLPVLGVVLFTIMPLFFSILIAFTNYSFGHIPPTQLFTWNGWQNFLTLFNAPADSMYALLPSAIMQTLGWTIIWTIFATFSNYFLGIILALMINKKGIRLKKMWRTIFILTIAIPQFISLMSIGVMLKDTGAIGVWFVNTFGYRLGFGTDSTNGALVSKIIIILVNVWVGIPYTMLSTSGILMNIPTDLYESAKVDGAGTFTQFSKITMPYILFVTGPYLITQFVGNINNFNIIYFLTGGGPNLSGTALQIGHTDLLITFLYKMITSNNNPQFGIASAVGIVIFVICAFFSIIMYNKSGAVQSEDQFQ